MKKVLVAVLSLALALSVVAPVAASAQSMSSAYSFNTNLTVGSKGADVVALQSFLVSKGFLVMPAGVAMGSFGPLTRNAVKAFQLSKNISPAAGYFGPITRQAVMANMGSAPTTPSTGTCPAGFTCSPNAGTPTTPTMTNSGVEGVVDVKIATTPVNDTNIRTQTDVPVYGIEFRGRIADVSVQTLDLEVAVSQSSASENPATLINTVKVWDGSTVLATLPVNSSTFVKDSSNRYYVRLSGLNFVVPTGTTKILTVSFSTNSIDATRDVVVKPYSVGNNIRTVSGNGVSSFYTLSDSRTHAFVKPGTSVLTISSTATPLRSQNYRVASTTAATGITLATWTARSTEGDSKIVTVYASTTGTVTPTAVELFDGSTKIGSATVSSNTVIFTNVDNVVSKDSTKTYTIKANFAANSAGNAGVTIKRVDYENPMGNTASVLSTVAGELVYLQVASVKFSLASVPSATPVVVGANTASTTYMEAKFPIVITTDTNGALTNQLVPANFTAVSINSSNATSSTGVTVASVDVPNQSMADGSATTAVVTVRLAPTGAAVGSNSYRFGISSIAWTVAGQSAVTQTWGLEDFLSTSGTFTK